jgi:PAS domain-containing protein
LVEANPAAIITADENGLIESANRAAAELIAPGETNLVGIPMATFFSRTAQRPQLGGSTQYHARRRNGESFLVDIRVSTYREEGDPKLGVMVKDAPAQGLANNEIASRIGISESTVKNTCQQLFAKADVRTRSQRLGCFGAIWGSPLSARFAGATWRWTRTRFGAVCRLSILVAVW